VIEKRTRIRQLGILLTAIVSVARTGSTPILQKQKTRVVYIDAQFDLYILKNTKLYKKACSDVALRLGIPLESVMASLDEPSSDPRVEAVVMAELDRVLPPFPPEGFPR
jgi:hypothetical protein